jgi:cytochrome c553
LNTWPRPLNKRAFTNVLSGIDMKKVALLLGLAIGWAPTGFAAANLTGDAAAGKNNSVACGACHGADGNSAVPSFPKLAGQGEKYLVKQMTDIRDGARLVPTMAGQLDGKSDQEAIDDILNQIQGLSDK